MLLSDKSVWNTISKLLKDHIKQKPQNALFIRVYTTFYINLLSSISARYVLQIFESVPLSNSPRSFVRSGLPAIKHRRVFFYEKSSCWALPCLTASIFSVQRLRRNEKLMRTSAPRYASLIVPKKPPALVYWKIVSFFAGCSPCTPTVQKADERLRLWVRERKQAPILGGGDLPSKGKYNRLGLAVVTRYTLWQRSCLMPPRGEIRRLLPHGECPRRVVSKGNAFGRSRKSEIFSKGGHYDTPPCVPCSKNQEFVFLGFGACPNKQKQI